MADVVAPAAPQQPRHRATGAAELGMSMAELVCLPARQQPRKPAVVGADATYSFADLDAGSTAFARFLISRGVTVGDRVAFVATKSASLIVAIVGCMKAGACYVPVDPRAPRERVAYILGDIAPRIVVAQPARHGEVASQLPSPCDVVDVDHLARLFEDGCHPGALPRVSGSDIAYVIYTSGSTGRPKGVVIEHRNVAQLFDVLADVMPITPSCRCMNTSELYFDVHVMDLMFPLHRGATVHLSRSPLLAEALLGTIEREKITHFTAVGPVMTLMAEGAAFDQRDLSSVVRIMTGAEIINVNTMQRWLRRVPGIHLVNGYGPTEATVIATAFVIDHAEPERTEFYPIGQPLRGTDVFVYEGGRIVSEPHVKGELLIAGPQVMRGYWNDEARTADKILWVGEHRCYRSGDICEWLPDGNLGYVGRTDEELKLSGFRIDLSEIKRVMDSTAGVAEGHAVAVAHPALGKAIAACFTRVGEEPDDDAMFAQVQAAFKRELPYYMVPSIYFLFDAFPKLPNGKTDKTEIANRVKQCTESDAAGAIRFTCRQGGGYR